MKKKAFPYIGTEGMGATMDPKGDLFMDPQRETMNRHDTFVAHKFTAPEEDQIPVTVIEEGMTGHMDVEGDEVDGNRAIDKEVTVEIWDEEEPIATFGCDVAKTLQEKVIGLQSYSGLEANAGLLFPYKTPKDVMYHMGTVSFPIDIIFVGNNDKIKKIYKNIKPGSWNTFGCSDVKSVLEICGGLSDRLGISKGNLIYIEQKGVKETNPSITKLCQSMGINRNLIIKHSGLEKLRVSNWKKYPILTLNNYELKKTANENISSSIALDLAANFSIENKKVSVFYFDNLINPEIFIHKVKEANEDENLYLTLDGKIVTAEDSRREHLDKIAIHKNESILSSNSVLFSFMPYSDETSDMLDFFRREYLAGNKIAVASSFKNKKVLNSLLRNRVNFEFGEFNAFESIETIDVPAKSDLLNIVEASRAKFKSDVYIFAPDVIQKEAGIPVPDDIKNYSRRAYKYLEKAEESIKKSLENMRINLTEYEKIQDNIESVSNTKGQYNQSIKRNTKVVKEYLLKIRDAIKILNEIKDISTTMEIIDSLANSAKNASSAVEDIFDLIDKLDSSDFTILLGEKTAGYEKAGEDLISSINRAKDYINSRILGLTILSG